MQSTATLQAVKDGWISPPFDQRLAGVTFSPQFVLRRPGSSPRLIDDHAASGLNDGIADVPCIYDRVPELIHLLRYLGLLDDSLPEHALLFKLDVASAFKIMLMHPLWQLRQAIEVAYPQRRGPPRVRFHIQWRAAFGSKASPYLWTSLMSAVHWVIVQRVPEVPWPFSYMDDTYSLARSGRWALFKHEGEIRRIPHELAAILRIWDEWGIPWRWKKVEFGRFLVITGLRLDLDSATISLPPGAVARFAAEVQEFLAEPSRRHPLKRWQQLVGYANWALTVLPFARPYLTPLFAKLRLPNGAPRPHSPYTPVFFNQEIRLNLSNFVAELQHGDPLDLRDPALSEWRSEDADLVIYTDACLEEKGGTGSGLGYWYELQGSRRHFFARPRVRWLSIQFAETLAVASALEQVVELIGAGGFATRPRRILVRSDSAPAIYAFDSGAAVDSEQAPLRTLVMASFNLVRLAKVDVKVRHIRGVHNYTADALSRASIRDLRSTYGSSLTQFVPPPALVGRALIQ